MSKDASERSLPQPSAILFELFANLVTTNPKKNLGHSQCIDISVERSPVMPLGRPYALTRQLTRSLAEAFIAYHDLVTSSTNLDANIEALRNERLVCNCRSVLCHGLILTTLANGKSVELKTWVDELRVEVSDWPRRVLVTGSRSWGDEAVVRAALAQQWERAAGERSTVLVVGDARGADHIAAELWGRAGLPVERHVARWDELGRRAGMVRNAEMVNSGIDRCVAFQVGDSPGTRECVRMAKEAGIPVEVFKA